MLSLEKIEKEIAELENRNTCYSVCEKLAWLYIVKDHMFNNANDKFESDIFSSDNEFYEFANYLEKDKLIKVLSEHMEKLKVLHPNEYYEIIEALKGEM